MITTKIVTFTKQICNDNKKIDNYNDKNNDNKKILIKIRSPKK